MYPWWLYVLPALITGIVAIVVQIVSALVTGRREKSRLDFERERWRVEQDQARVRQFQADKRERFFQYLPVVWEYAHLVLATGEANRVQRELWHEMKNKRATVGHQLMDLQREITLLAPELEPVFDDVLDVFNRRSFDDWEDEDERLHMRDEFSAKIQVLEGAMRQSLGVESLVAKPHNQPQLSEAPGAKDAAIEPKPTP